MMSAEKKSLHAVKLTDATVSTVHECFQGMQVKVSDHEKQVIEMLKVAATTIGSHDDHKESVDQEIDSAPEWYLEMRRRLLPTLPRVEVKDARDARDARDANEAEEKADLPMKRAEAIRTENTGKRVLAHLATVETWMKTRPLSPPTCSNPSFPVELRVLVVMVCMQHRLDRLGEVSHTEHLELIVAGMKLLHRIGAIRVWNKTRQCLDEVHPRLRTDLEWVLDRYRRTVRFNVCQIASECPRLMIRTQWDQYLPGMGLSAYPSQQEVLRYTDEYLSGTRSPSGMIWLSTLTGEGKTSLVIALAKMVMDHNRRHPRQSVHLLYTCDVALTTIRQQVGQSALTGAIPFGVTEWNPDGFVDYDHPATAPAPRVLTIATRDTAVQMLKEKKKTYLLFFDEPTFGLDEPDADTNRLVDIMSCLPFLSVWASATAPRLVDMPSLARLNGVQVHEVRSTRVQIGAELFGWKGDLFVPHQQHASTATTLAHRVQRVRESGFLQKSYTAAVVHHLWEVVDSQLDDIPSFQTFFADPTHLCQSSIQSLGLSYLALCVDEDDDEVTSAVCDNSIHPKADTMVWDDLLTTFHRYQQQTLVVVDQPTEAFERWVRPYLEQTGVHFADSLRQFAKEIAVFDAMVETVHEDVRKKPKLSQLERERWLNERLADIEPKRPHIDLPSKWILGSRAHYAAFTPQSEGREREYVLPENIDWDRIACQDLYQMALAVGVGVISPGDMSPSYTQTVRDMAARGQLAYVIAGEAIGYGTNYPFETILIHSTLAHRSVNSLFQLFARAGRPGKSWRARIHLPDEMRDRLQSFVEVEEDAVETRRINEAIEQAISTSSSSVLSSSSSTCVLTEKIKLEKEAIVKLTEMILDSWEDEE